MITPQDLLRLASRLAIAPSADAAQFRAAISRAYYSAFHAAVELLARVGIRAGHNHGEVHRSLAESGVGKAELAGRRISDLHSFRVKADYDLSTSPVEARAQAQECVELALDIGVLLQELDTVEGRQQIKAGIEAYRRKLGRA